MDNLDYEPQVGDYVQVLTEPDWFGRVDEITDDGFYYVKRQITQPGVHTFAPRYVTYRATKSELRRVAGL